jgi:hypothetical protein
MLLQTSIVALLVLGCACYATWTLLPAAGRRVLARRLLRMPWPAAVATRLRRHAMASGGCACDGCDRAAPVRDASQPQPIRLPRRSPGR